jgi:hypothetical protein
LIALELLDKGKIVLYENKTKKFVIVPENVQPEQVVALRDGLTAKGYELIEDSGVYEVEAFADFGVWSRFLEEAILTHVQDLGEDRTAAITKFGMGRKVIVTSPNNDQLKTLHNTNGLLILYMPLWTLEELKLVHDAIYPDVSERVLFQQFERFGGIIRFVLEYDPSQVEKYVRVAMARLTVSDLVELFRVSSYWNLPSQRDTGYFVHVVPQRVEESFGKNTTLGTPELDELSRSYRNFTCQFATPLIERELAERFIEDQSFSVQGFAIAVSSCSEFKSWYGYMLEARAHRILPKGGAFKMKLLSSKGPQMSEWSIPVLDVLNPPFTALTAVENVVI